MRGAWIEIERCAMVLRILRRRSPCGERGLKSLLVLCQHPKLLSLPVRGGVG